MGLAGRVDLPDDQSNTINRRLYTMNDHSKPTKTAKPKVKQPDIAGGSTTNDQPEPTKIEKPRSASSTNSSRRRRRNIAGVETLLTAADQADCRGRRLGRLHPDEDICWTCELCFVAVPIIGEKRAILHLIDEDVAVQYLSAKKIKRHRLALATMPGDKFFLCIVPSQNLDNSWNKTALEICKGQDRMGAGPLAQSGGC